MLPQSKSIRRFWSLGLLLLALLSGCSRETALAIAQGMRDYADAPRSYSTYTSSTRIGQRTYRSITTCSSSVYGGHCYTSTR